MKLTRQEFINKVLTFKNGKNAYGFKDHAGTTIQPGVFVSIASKGTKILTCVSTGNKTICTIFNYVNEEFHRFDENTADKYLK